VFDAGSLPNVLLVRLLENVRVGVQVGRQVGRAVDDQRTARLDEGAQLLTTRYHVDQPGEQRSLCPAQIEELVKLGIGDEQTPPVNGHRRRGRLQASSAIHGRLVDSRKAARC